MNLPEIAQALTLLGIAGRDGLGDAGLRPDHRMVPDHERAVLAPVDDRRPGPDVDVTAGTLKRVSIGAADSGGAGYKVLRVPN